MKLLKFAATWCGPCQGLKMTMANMGDLINISVEEIDIDNKQELAIQYGVRSVPTLIIVDDEGKEVRRATGNLTQDKLLEFIGV